MSSKNYISQQNNILQTLITILNNTNKLSITNIYKITCLSKFVYAYLLMYKLKCEIRLF